jgi:hypothetical protein
VIRSLRRLIALLPDLDARVAGYGPHQDFGQDRSDQSKNIANPRLTKGLLNAYSRRLDLKMIS